VTATPVIADELWNEFERARRMRPLDTPTAPTPRAVVDPTGAAVRAAQFTETNFSSLLRRRRSLRQFEPIDLDDISAVLVDVDQLLHFAPGDDGYQRSWRPCPSAGGRHTIDLAVAVAVAEVGDRAGGAWHFDSSRLQFESASFSVDNALEEVRQALDTAGPPPAAIFAVAALDRTLSRYPEGSSLVWRDAGAVLLALHLAATERGMASCIAATCGAIAFDRAEARVDVGSLAIGAKVS
jgi:SagB-type dehydrogenase family enzyme